MLTLLFNKSFSPEQEVISSELGNIVVPMSVADGKEWGVGVNRLVTRVSHVCHVNRRAERKKLYRRDFGMYEIPIELRCIHIVGLAAPSGLNGLSKI